MGLEKECLHLMVEEFWLQEEQKEEKDWQLAKQELKDNLSSENKITVSERVYLLDIFSLL